MKTTRGQGTRHKRQKDNGDWEGRLRQVTRDPGERDHCRESQ
jgi:hypothetical protein